MRTVNKVFVLLAVSSVFSAQLVSASEWRGDVEQQTGFSDFAPPKTFSGFQGSAGGKEWGNGTSFNVENKVRYSPSVSRNPWKPTNSLHYKKSFSSKRPWGNLPEKKPKNTNMKLHDQRFKQWSHRQDPSFRDRSMLLNTYSSSGYGNRNSLYRSPLITPAIHPRQILNPLGYGAYPGLSYPGIGYPGAGLSPRPWTW